MADFAASPTGARVTNYDQPLLGHDITRGILRSDDGLTVKGASVLPTRPIRAEQLLLIPHHREHAFLLFTLRRQLFIGRSGQSLSLDRPDEQFPELPDLVVRERLSAFRPALRVAYGRCVPLAPRSSSFDLQQSRREGLFGEAWPCFQVPRVRPRQHGPQVRIHAHHVLDLPDFGIRGGRGRSGPL